MKISLLFILSFVFSVSLHAACTSPAGDEGAIRYDSTAKNFYGCDGTNWTALGPGNTGTPSGAVLPFDLASCPAGWTEFTEARGRFIRGIDSTGANDPAGVRALRSIQNDALQNITGALSTGHGLGLYNGGQGTGAIRTTGGGLLTQGGAAGPAQYRRSFDFNASRVVRTSNETRPKNVALLYCRKD